MTDVQTAITTKQKRKVVKKPYTKALRAAFCAIVDTREIGMSGVTPKRTTPAARRKLAGISFLQTFVTHEKIRSFGSPGDGSLLAIYAVSYMY
jgi:hypothetical protein